MWIQLLLLLGIAGVTFLLTRSTAGARHQAIRRLLLVGFVLVAVVSVLFPEILTATARVLGVGRGADLLLYILVIAFLGTVASSYRRLAEMDRKITVLARKLALAEAMLTERTDEVRAEATKEIAELRNERVAPDRVGPDADHHEM